MVLKPYTQLASLSLGSNTKIKKYICDQLETLKNNSNFTTPPTVKHLNSKDVFLPLIHLISIRY